MATVNGTIVDYGTLFPNNATESGPAFDRFVRLAGGLTVWVLEQAATVFVGALAVALSKWPPVVLAALTVGWAVALWAAGRALWRKLTSTTLVNHGTMTVIMLVRACTARRGMQGLVDDALAQASLPQQPLLLQQQGGSAKPA